MIRLPQRLALIGAFCLLGSDESGFAQQDTRPESSHSVVEQFPHSK
jgi:hypothetical protein